VKMDLPGLAKMEHAAEMESQMAEALLSDSAASGPASARREREALKKDVCHETTVLSASEFGSKLHALILTGSLARNEATFVEKGKEWSLLGDAEFLLAFSDQSSLPSIGNLELLRQKIEHSLSLRGICAPLVLDAVRTRYFRKLKPHIYAYELRKGGQVIWGEPEILSVIRDFSASEIPLEDAWRLLANRMIEYLEMVQQLAGNKRSFSGSMLYRAMKLYLDLATSFLLFTGDYAPTYAQRAENLKILANTSSSARAFPFDLRAFSDRVTACTRWKLCPTDSEGMRAALLASGDRSPFWEEAVAYAKSLWRWEVVRLSRASPEASGAELRERWMHLQPLHCRLRGWAYILRRQGLLKSWRHWSRWTRQAWRASPRYSIYAAASELFFRLHDLLGSNGGRLAETDCQRLRDWLPVCLEQEQTARSPDWSHLAAEIAWNYHRFVVGTRS
jgi:hypothetical protein